MKITTTGGSQALDARSNMALLFPGLVALFGIAFIVGGFNTLSNARHLAAVGQKTTGYVTDVERVRVEKRDSNGFKKTSYEYRATISYSTPDGFNGTKVFKKKLEEGDAVELTYEPADPSNVTIGQPSGSSGFVLIAIGVLITGGGAFWAFYTLQKRKLIERLIASGRVVKAEVIGVDMSERRHRRGTGSGYRRSRTTRSWVVRCKSSETGMTYESDAVSVDPGEIHGQELSVFVDRGDANSYWVDVFGEHPR